MYSRLAIVALSAPPPGVNELCVCVCVLCWGTLTILYLDILYLEERLAGSERSGGQMASPHPDPRSAWKPKPLSALRRPSSLLKSIDPAPPPNRTTPQPINEPLHQISIRYSTIAARALSFQGQVLTGITPLRLARNGLYYRLHPGFGPTACCFTCQSATPLNAFQRTSIQGAQQLHKVD